MIPLLTFLIMIISLALGCSQVEQSYPQLDHSQYHTQDVRTPTTAPPIDLGVMDMGREGGSIDHMMDRMDLDSTLHTSSDMSADMSVDDMESEAPQIDMGSSDQPSPESSLPSSWTIFSGNPILRPTSNAQSQGLDNIYAPHVVHHQGRWWMWYGGQGADGKDAIFLAWSDDLVSWSNHGGQNPIPVVDHGASNHVNDPTVVFGGNLDSTRQEIQRTL